MSRGAQTHTPHRLDWQSPWVGDPLRAEQELTWPCLPDAKGLSNPSEVEMLREKVYATLEAYTKQKYPDQPGR